jgi:magnesium transporter
LLGIVLGAVVLAWSYVLGRDIQVALVVSLTLIAISTLATVIGSIMPFLFRLVNVDPAMVSAPLITTVMDIFGVALYFYMAHLVLQL